MTEKGKKGVLIPKWAVRGRKDIMSRGNDPAAAFSPPHTPAPSLPPERED